MKIDDALLRLSFNLVKLKRSASIRRVSSQKILNDFCTQILELASIRTGLSQLSNTIDKSVVAKRSFEAFELLYRNSLKQFQVLNSVLTACALVVDRRNRE